MRACELRVHEGAPDATPPTDEEYCPETGYRRATAFRKPYKMTVNDVVHELNEEAVWFDGFDLLERRTNDQLESRKTEQRTRTIEESSNSDDSSLSSKLDGSTTSPVLSTSTLQTTPSPPPKEAILIPVLPILDPPRLLRPIPYVPESLIHLPEQSLEGFQ
ncbi:hypothetical protein IW262DRAFT_533486 [Armillaria fumosa]|nr:hypothetical protein IW262DRAFT_533486 [Armillaria fumosa]